MHPHSPNPPYPPETLAAQTLQHILVVLVRPSHMGNIGACARAMKVMGLTRLAIVGNTPLDTTAYARAAGAQDILQGARRFSTTAEAIQHAQLVIASSARTRSVPWPLLNPQQAAERLVEGARCEWEVTLLLGCEQSGLSNEDLQLSHFQLMIDTAAPYHSLNLAMALQIITYEIRLALIKDSESSNTTVRGLASRKPSLENPATIGTLCQFYLQFEKLLKETGYAAEEGQLFARLKRLLMQLKPTQREINALIGLLTRVRQAIQPLPAIAPDALKRSRSRLEPGSQADQ